MSPRLVYLLLVIVHAAQLAWAAPRLPATVPSHFDAAGVANDWLPRGAFLVLLGGLTLFNLALFFGIAALIRRGPAALINMPHRDHWLAPERSAATRATLAADLFKIAIATQGLLIVMTHQTFEVALGRRPTLGVGSWLALAAFLGYVLWWCLALYRRFGRPPPGDGERSAPVAGPLGPS